MSPTPARTPLDRIHLTYAAKWHPGRIQLAGLRILSAILVFETLPGRTLLVPDRRPVCLSVVTNKVVRGSPEANGGGPHLNTSLVKVPIPPERARVGPRGVCKSARIMRSPITPRDACQRLPAYVRCGRRLSSSVAS
ncbi:unnamed protein product, partial [Iphiclides podalirius]